jgi:hypothetical protein
MSLRSSLVLCLSVAAPLLSCTAAAPPPDPALCDPAALDPTIGSIMVAGDLATGPNAVAFDAQNGFVGYRFRVGRGQRVTLSLASDLDAYLLVYGPQANDVWGAPIDRNDTTADVAGTNAQIQLTAPSSGTYLVVATTRRNASACAPGDMGAATLTYDPGLNRASEIGSGDHTRESVSFTMVLATGMNLPSAIAFNPYSPNELWVTNRGSDAFTFLNTATPGAQPIVVRDTSDHFLNNPTSFAFSDNMFLATCQESNNDYNGHAAVANMFMGPVIYPASTDLIRRQGVMGSHRDMLHHSPYCMGIAAAGGTEFWVFNGEVGAIDRYRFNTFHQPGGDDHADGQAWRFAVGQVQRVPDVPSHMVIDPMTHRLYIADTGNSRIASMDVNSPPETGQQIPAHNPEVPLIGIDGYTLQTVVAGTAGMLTHPSGLLLYHDLLWVSDNANSRISVFTTSGERVNYIDTGLPEGSLTGLAFGPDGKLYFSNRLGNQVVRIDP